MKEAADKNKMAYFPIYYSDTILTVLAFCKFGPQATKNFLNIRL